MAIAYFSDSRSSLGNIAKKINPHKDALMCIASLLSCFVKWCKWL